VELAWIEGRTPALAARWTIRLIGPSRSNTMATNSASEQSPSYTATLSGQPDVRRIRFCLLMRTS